MEEMKSRTTHGIYKNGDVVLRPQGENAEFVHQVLLYLEEQGLNGVPRYLGNDEEGREKLSYLDGECPQELGYYTDAVTGRAALLIRSLHQLLSKYPGCPERMTVCHNDLSPCNFVFKNETPVGIIDWDSASFGDPLDDLAYAAWMWLDIGNPEISGYKCRRRLARFLDDYGLARTDGFKERILKQMDRVAECVFEDAEQTKATREWALQCRCWAEENLR